MPRFTPQTTESIYAQMLARMVVMGGLTDVTDSSVINHLLLAIARALDEGYYQAAQIPAGFSIDTCSGADLRARAKDIQPGLLQPISEQSATVSLVFTREVVAGDVIVPLGTQVLTASGQVFETTEQGIIYAAGQPTLDTSTVGQDSTLVPAIAQQPGTAGNVASNTLVRFRQTIEGVDAVTNPGPAARGIDAETDDSFRARLKGYVSTLAKSTVSALEACVLSATDPVTGDRILYSSLLEDPLNPGKVTLYVDDGTGQSGVSADVADEVVTYGLSGPPVNTAVGGETSLPLQNGAIDLRSPYTVTSSTRGNLKAGTDYTLVPGQGRLYFATALAQGEQITASYTYYTGVVGLAQKIVDGDPNDRLNFPGYRAAGISVEVLPPQVIVPPVSATITVGKGYDVASVYATVGDAILTAINSLPISGDVLLADLYNAVTNIDGVANVIFTQPTQDVAILDSQIARTTTDNIVVS
ncbi:MAG: hypothetical protein EOO40_00995 [Deltaproteobacteria bacterium]|nr:MAG: hypothetical protein EOO40_00995 [Deltaproteobacteria bacterium]